MKIQNIPTVKTVFEQGKREKKKKIFKCERHMSLQFQRNSYKCDNARVMRKRRSFCKNHKTAKTVDKTLAVCVLFSYSIENLCTVVTNYIKK